MGTMTNPSRRALLAAAASSAAGLALSTPALALVEPSPLPGMIDRYFAAKDASEAADAAYAAVRTAIEAELSVSRVQLRENPRSADDYLPLTAGEGVASVTAAINYRFSQLIAAAEEKLKCGRNFAGPTWKQAATVDLSPADLRAECERVLSRALGPANQVDALQERFDYAAIDDRATKAWDEKDSAKGAILDFRPATLTEMRLQASFARSEVIGEGAVRVEAFEDIARLFAALAGEH